jgi:hypothetical protein
MMGVNYTQASPIGHFALQTNPALNLLLLLILGPEEVAASDGAWNELVIAGP